MVGLGAQWIKTLHALSLTITTSTVSMPHGTLNDGTELLTHHIILSRAFCTDTAINVGYSQETGDLSLETPGGLDVGGLASGTQSFRPSPTKIPRLPCGGSDLRHLVL